MHTGDLLNSFHSHVTMDADGNSALISFAFQYYLRMLEMGVGKGVSFDDVKSNTLNRREDGRQTGNRRKPIRGLYSGVFYGEAMRLLELMQAAYAKEGAKIIMDEFMHGTGEPTEYITKKHFLRSYFKR